MTSGATENIIQQLTSISILIDIDYYRYAIGLERLDKTIIKRNKIDKLLLPDIFIDKNY